MIQKIIGVLIILGGIAAGIYLGLWLCFVGGVMEIVAGIKANPVSAEDIAFGLLRVVCTGFVTWTTIIFCAFIGSAVVATSSDSTYKSKNRIRW